jgi:hypothetical protein
MSCPTGDLDMGATKPMRMFLASGDGVEVVIGVLEGEGVGEAEGETGCVNCQVPIPAATTIIIIATIAANGFVFIPISPFFSVYQSELLIKLS